LCNRIAAEGWVEMTPSLVRSLSTGDRAIAMKDRPDAQALLRLHPGKSLSEIVFDVVKEPSRGILASRWRMSAWELVNQLGAPEKELHEWLGDDSMYESGDSFYDALHRGFTELGVVPVTVEEVKWLNTLQAESYGEWWAKCRDAVELVPVANRHDLRMRNLAVLISVERFHPQWMKLSRGELYSELAGAFAGRQHYLSGMVGQGVSKPMYPQLLEDWQDDLRWVDLLTIKLADLLVREKSIHADLFRLVESDRVDESTEYGGILDIDDEGDAVLLSFPPQRSVNDTRYRASSKMVTRGYTALFHFHLHVQEEKNRDYAGPGTGDLNYADIMGVNGLVFTSIHADTLNVDYYESGKISVDVGLVNR